MRSFGLKHFFWNKIFFLRSRSSLWVTRNDKLLDDWEAWEAAQ